MRFLGFITVFFALAFLPVSSHAEKNFASPQGAGQVDSGGSSAPAQQWLRYYKGNSGDSFATISRFLIRHRGFPAQDKIRKEAEQVMPNNMDDAAVIGWFKDNPPQSVRGMTFYAQALMRAGRNDEARKAVNEWWPKASLSREEQRDGYGRFSHMLSKQANEDRLRILIYREQYTNARAIATLLGGGHSALAEARIALRSGKGDVNGLINRVPTSLQNDEGLLYDRLVWRRKADANSGAVEILNLAPSSDKMYDSEDWGKERGIIARRLFEEKKYGQAYRISANHKTKDKLGFSQNEWMAGWLALEYLNKPWDAFEHFERLYHGVESPLSKSRAAYWSGLASERLKHPEIARKWYEVGAVYSTTFYGQLSEEKLGRPGGVKPSGASINPSVKNSDVAQAARWLKRNGYKAEATMFFNRMIEDGKAPEDFAAIADVASSAGMKNLAIKAAQESEKKTGVVLLGYAFPKVEKQLGNIDFVEWALVHALIRQESRYDENAVSSAGARGLMQLMPRTAKEVARKAGMNHQTDWLTSKPSHNVALGSRFLKQMLDRYDGNYAMALAAYNAGPGRVDRWINEIGDPRSPKVDLVNWIEMIPIYETRNYVQRVLEGVQVYRQTLSSNKGKPVGEIHLASRMPSQN